MTQRGKERRAPGPGPTYAAADLSEQTAADALLAAGLDRSRPALFVCEGLTMYLGEDVVRHQFGELARVSTVASRLAADFSPPRDAGTAGNRRQDLFQRLARSGSGETVRLVVSRRQATALVEESGWSVNEATSMRDAARALVSPDAGLPIDAVNADKTLVAAALL